MWHCNALPLGVLPRVRSWLDCEGLVRPFSWSVQRRSRKTGDQTLSIEAHEGKTLAELILPGLQSALYSMSLIEGAKDKARRGLRVLRSFLNGVKVKIQDVEFGLSIDPERGAADSGDLETDLPNLFLSIGEAARSAGKPFALLIDELQYLSQEEFSALIMSMHKITQANLPIILIRGSLCTDTRVGRQVKVLYRETFQIPENWRTS